jgi:hypothetical protein
MAEERPPGWVPVDQHVGQMPMVITSDFNPAGVPSDVNPRPLADQIVRQNQPVINRFVSIQRQQIEVGGLDIHSSVLPLKDMSVYSSYVQGREKMHYHVTPQVEVLPEPPQAQEEPPAPPTPPIPEEPPEVSRPPDPEIKVPELESPPTVPEAKAPEEIRPPEEQPPEAEAPKLPEEEKPPELPPEEKPPELPPEEKPPEEEKFERHAKPDFLSIDMPTNISVEFSDGSG